MTRFQCADCGKQLDLDNHTDEEIESIVRDGHRMHTWIRLEEQQQQQEEKK